MKTVAFYISDYGYGHASRSIAVIREMLRQFDEELKVIICHSFANRFLEDSLKELHVEIRTVNTDVGYVLRENSMFPDQEKLVQANLSFTYNWDERLGEEYQFLKKNNVDLVISDISPLPFIPAYNLGIPSIGLSNFTWFTAYHNLIDESLLEVFQTAYEKMSYFFALAGANEPDWGMKGNFKFGFLSREVNVSEVEKIRKLVNPEKDKTIVYFGLGMKISIEQLKRLPLWNSENCLFLVSNNVNINRPNVFKIPENYAESQNYIAAADIVITKAGWSTISEAVIHQKPLIILERMDMNEDKNTANYLKSIKTVKLLYWEEILNLKINKEILAELEKQNTSLISNEVYDIVKEIRSIGEGSLISLP
jgi:uncharacterized protein (TIGR00661 family)